MQDGCINVNRTNMQLIDKPGYKRQATHQVALGRFVLMQSKSSLQSFEGTDHFSVIVCPSSPPTESGCRVSLLSRRC